MRKDSGNRIKKVKNFLASVLSIGVLIALGIYFDIIMVIYDFVSSDLGSKLLTSFIPSLLTIVIITAIVKVEEERRSRTLKESILLRVQINMAKIRDWIRIIETDRSNSTVPPLPYSPQQLQIMMGEFRSDLLTTLAIGGASIPENIRALLLTIENRLDLYVTLIPFPRGQGANDLAKDRCIVPIYDSLIAIYHIIDSSISFEVLEQFIGPIRQRLQQEEAAVREPSSPNQRK